MAQHFTQISKLRTLTQSVELKKLDKNTQI